MAGFGPWSGAVAVAATLAAASPSGASAGDGPRVSCKFPGLTCGFVDAGGKVVIQPDFDWAEEFSGSVARVKIKGVYGVIDRFGRNVTPARWSYISRFDRGRAVVVADGRYGVIDGFGREIVPPRYATVVPLKDDVFLVDAETPGPVDPGRLEADEGTSPLGSATPGRWGVLEAPDVWLLTPRFREVKAFSPEGSGSFWGRPTQKWQLVSVRGGLLTGAVFDQVEPAEGGLAVVRTANQWNVVDDGGRMLLPPGAVAVRRRSDGTVSYQIDGLVGVVGRAGEVAVPAHFDSIGIFVEGRARAVRGGAEIWIDGRGRTASAPDKTSSASIVAKKRKAKSPVRRLECPAGPDLRRTKAGWQFVDRHGRPAIDRSFAAARCFFRGVALVVKPGGRGWTKIDGRGDPVDGNFLCPLPDYAVDPASVAGIPPRCGP